MHTTVPAGWRQISWARCRNWAALAIVVSVMFACAHLRAHDTHTCLVGRVAADDSTLSAIAHELRAIRVTSLNHAPDGTAKVTLSYTELDGHWWWNGDSIRVDAASLFDVLSLRARISGDTVTGEFELRTDVIRTDVPIRPWVATVASCAG